MRRDALFAGIDIGSVSVNIALLDGELRLAGRKYIRTAGAPLAAVRAGLSAALAEAGGRAIAGAGTTGSGRHLIGHLIGADEIKNEITAHSVAAIHFFPDVSTVLEIGGQDSKIIIIRDRVVVDFAMNTICAAGTGSFLDQQAQRLGMDIGDFGAMAARSGSPTKIAGRCGIFAESDMIHKQQMGYPREDIVAGLCDALVSNYLNNVGRGKKIDDRVIFQGGVAANAGIVGSFERALGKRVTVPEHHDIMGAIGAAIIAAKAFERSPGRRTGFTGCGALEGSIESSAFECTACPNRCDIVSVKKDSRTLFNLGGRCGRFDGQAVN